MKADQSTENYAKYLVVPFHGTCCARQSTSAHLPLTPSVENRKIERAKWWSTVSALSNSFLITCCNSFRTTSPSLASTHTYWVHLAISPPLTINCLQNELNAHLRGKLEIHSMSGLGPGRYGKTQKVINQRFQVRMLKYDCDKVMR